MRMIPAFRASLVLALLICMSATIALRAEYAQRRFLHADQHAHHQLRHQEHVASGERGRNRLRSLRSLPASRRL